MLWCEKCSVLLQLLAHILSKIPNSGAIKLIDMRYKNGLAIQWRNKNGRRELTVR